MGEGEEEVIDDEDEQKMIDELSIQLENKESKIRNLKSNILDLSEENIRINSQIDNIGLSGALNFTKKIYDDVRNLDYQIKNKIDDEYKLQTLLGLDDNNNKKKKVVMNGGEKVDNENENS